MPPEHGHHDRRKGSGVHFTPGPLAHDLALRVFEQPGSAAGGALDPACGDGALLAAAWHIGRERGLRPERLFGFEVDPELAERARLRLRRSIGGEPGERAAQNVITADALSPELAWPRATSIVANPPWVSFSGRQSRRSAGEERASGRGWPSLHGAFLERIAEHVAANATPAAILLPAAVLDGDGYGALRERVTSLTELAGSPRELGEAAFPGVVEPACLVELRPRRSPGPGSNTTWSRPASHEVLEHLRPFPNLPPECFGDPGVHSGNSARELIVRSGRLDLPGVREGRDLTAYRLAAPRIRLDVELERSESRRFRYSKLDRYRAVPVLVRQTADRPIAALHVEPTYFRNTLLACTPPPELDPRFVVAVLNSSCACTWHRKNFRDARQRTFPQVKVAHLRSLPMPFLDRSEAPALHDRVVRSVRAGAFERADALVGEAFGLAALGTPEETGAGRLA